MPTARHAILSEIAPRAKKGGDLRVVVETPKGSRNKFKYLPDCDCMELTTVLPEGMTFPYDFGFIPSTRGKDGDPLDVLVLSPAPAVSGCIVRARLLGAIEAAQKEKGGKWVRNDRFIAAAIHAQTHESLKSLSDLRPHLLEEITGFFVEYNKLRNRKFKVLGEAGARKAQKLVESGRKAFARQHRSKA